MVPGGLVVRPTACGQPDWPLVGWLVPRLLARTVPLADAAPAVPVRVAGHIVRDRRLRVGGPHQGGGDRGRLIRYRRGCIQVGVLAGPWRTFDFVTAHEAVAEFGIDSQILPCGEPALRSTGRECYLTERGGTCRS